MNKMLEFSQFYSWSYNLKRLFIRPSKAVVS